MQRNIAVALAVTTFILSSQAFAADALTTAPRGGCVAVKLAVEPNRVMPGDPIQVTGAVANCGRRWDFIKLVLKLRRDGADRVIREWSLRLGPRMSREVATKFAAPKPGAYIAVLRTKSRRGGSDRAAVKLVVSEK